ncbi:MAG: hypothetical protein SFZ24_01585 [Planctomycetota bacterium]|nr:hypothetical protein [Planctomycetota bacterium]
MATPSEPTRRPNLPFIATTLWFLILIIAALMIAVRPTVPPLWALSAVGLIALFMPLSMLLAWRVGESRGTASEESQMAELIEAVRRQTDEGGLSEGAKRVIHRRRERELLRRAIEQDIQDEDWDAAMVLVKELAEQFGYRADAEEFRSRIERARAQTLDRHVVEALAGLDEMVRRRQWPEAYAEAARIQRLYPESHRVEGLRARIDQNRESYRRDLERRFLLAADKDAVDEAMMLLQELDLYLTPSEAAPYQEVARGVIGKLRENLGVRFKLAVQDHLWDDAVGVGEQIITQFPNTRMAQEVRDLMPTLRERATRGLRASVRG